MKRFRLTILSFINILILDIQLRVKKFKNVIGEYCEKYENIDIEIYRNYPKEEQIKLQKDLDITIIAIENASELYPFNAKCLHRTLIGYKLLRKKYNFPVKFVIGVKKFPFDSHAWLKWNDEFGGKNLFELEEDTDKYQIIIDSSKYKGGVSL
ncbi:lasso peptide biosynthesis B2 protein [Clostridium botulinum]|uniref:lasso peptide biosynthesis B2 protein n=1 Tax=Clostridium botulinum TaxID=1491 RepID=UPI000371FDF8|nr:lasso peptide biosynthesis B2 protein [Clostridium botulinum]MBN1037035.1 lasso peptide biosynthesis B2 protein [Clostridium botulinum]MBY6932197.1 lasso peptide biosynthesis B2 protein [Clostridium botulinum]NFG21646.1 lasso peptide biosynthesis B2 protein [Clostridium botulinum]NFG25260.1 lasso peptide biosynthesis B2 protein [Clostridium botulinum]NFO82288.1 lasso peptide biosynthesis B2 protein [Clostridium botulinum]